MRRVAASCAVLFGCALAAILAAPASASSASAPVPLTIDTDIFSSVDDVGALSIGFALQLQHEANVIAIGVSTRTDRPAVATDSWRCAAAVARFYNSGSVPIGSDMPDDGTAVNDPDFVGPCGKLAAPSTPSPDTAVSVYRRALARQADGSVVMVSTGYLENMAALLDSPPDAISPLSGRRLIARKVKVLIVMAGGFPSRSGENNLRGNPAAARNVANHWPTKLVWAGYEVGDALHTGETLADAQPASSPVRVAYEAFVGPDNWYFSYDLAAVYHAVRPADPLLTEIGPGRNAIDNAGGNVFTAGAGNQYYLSLSDADALDSTLEALLDIVPPDITPPAITGVSAGSIGLDGATIAWATDEPADTQVEYGTTTAYGSSTTLDTSLASTHSQTLSGLAPGTLYHYRVRSRDAAGNLATSPDLTFATMDLVAYVGSLSIDPGLAHDLQGRAADAERKLAAGNRKGGCQTLTDFARRVLDEWSRPGSRLTLAQAKSLLAGVFVVDAWAGCIAPGSTLPQAEAALADLIGGVVALNLEAGFAEDLTGRLGDAGKKLADGKRKDGCKGLDRFAQQVVDELGEDGARLTVAQAKELLSGVYAVEVVAGCLDPASSLPAGEAAVADLISSVEGVADRETADDLRRAASDAGKAAAGRAGSTCQKLRKLQQKIDAAALQGKLTASQTAAFTAAVAAIGPQLGCLSTRQ